MMSFLLYSFLRLKSDRTSQKKSVFCVSAGAGTDHRNHCPNCLSSLHVDIEPGDRESDCGGIMDPIAVWTRKNGEWAIIHRCRRCGKLSSNRIAADDNPMKFSFLHKLFVIMHIFFRIIHLAFHIRYFILIVKEITK